MATLRTSTPTSMPETGNVTRPLTILRVKRKRTEEPYDGFVVEQPENLAEKKARQDPGQTIPRPLAKVFRFAETVDLNAFEISETAQSLQEKLARFAQRKKAVLDRLKPSPLEETQDKTESDLLDDKLADRRNQLAQEKAKASEHARFRVMNLNRAALPADLESGSPTSDAEPLGPETQRLFDLFDAVKEDVCDTSSRNSKQAKAGASDITCNLVPMMEEYLAVEKNDKDYVYDVYFVDDLQDGERTLAGTQYASLLWTADDENYHQEADTSDEESDHDDQDSNAEDFYANDYPDEEDWSDEAGGFHSEGDVSDEYDDGSWEL